jgi:competence protein ComEA
MVNNNLVGIYKTILKPNHIIFVIRKLNMKRLLVVVFAAFCSFNVLASPVNINTADAKTIGEALSGIGLKKAEAIVKYRETKGEFKTAEDLVNVDGIGPRVCKNASSVNISSRPSTGSADETLHSKYRPNPGHSIS